MQQILQILMLAVLAWASGFLGGLSSGMEWDAADAPLAVVDFGRLATGLADTDEGGARKAAAVADLRAQIERLRQAGYVVLDAKAVVAAPEGRYVQAR
jgi:hypothetical protein